MELDDLKNTWNEMSNQAKEKQNLNLKTFDIMGKKKFNSNLKKILLPEILGSLVSIAAAVFTGFNFYRFGTVAFQLAGVLAILLLVLLPIISLVSIQQLYKAGDMGKSYADTLKEFTLQKIKFCKLQKINITLSYLLLVTVILLSTKLFGTNHITESKYFFIFSYSFGFIFLMFFAKWVFKGYNKTIKETEKLLNELPA